MSNEVYANGMELACKAGQGKSICALPDVCFTPPQTPATPPGVPIPYPNTGMASDTTDGSKTVQISGKEVMLKNKSYFKKSTGDEAGCAPKKGVVTSKNTGKVYFNAWSMDVKFEGENVVRHLDITTHNHASVPGNTPTWPFIDQGAFAKGGPCSKEKKAEEDACAHLDEDDKCKNKKCQQARRCMLVPYSPEKSKGQGGCCPGQTPHHLIEVHCFTKVGERESADRIRGFSKYDDNKAPCVCCDESSRYEGDHGNMHAIQGMCERNCMNPDGPRSQMGGDGSWDYGAAKKGALAAHKETFPKSNCRDQCLEAQLDAYHKQIGVKDDTTKLRADRSPLTEEQKDIGASALG
ncbi:MAG: DUF4150 domain-containing protein [Desulfuromonadales bacterium]|nr:DUF4150 domain-containing protein [Desulfuromonadales bacterium]